MRTWRCSHACLWISNTSTTRSTQFMHYCTANLCYYRAQIIILKIISPYNTSTTDVTNLNLHRLAFTVPYPSYHPNSPTQTKHCKQLAEPDITLLRANPAAWMVTSGVHLACHEATWRTVRWITKPTYFCGLLQVVESSILHEMFYFY